jgi:hypothetical protein
VAASVALSSNGELAILELVTDNWNCRKIVLGAAVRYCRESKPSTETSDTSSIVLK